MLTLVLDTSSRAGSIAILRDDRVLGVISTETDEAFSSRIFRQLEFLSREVSVNPNQMELFAVVAGPGSFSGLRVGLTAVKAWAEVYEKPIVAVSALEAIASQSYADSSLVFPVLDARRGQIYFGAYRQVRPGEFQAEGEEFVLTAEEFLANVRDRFATLESIRVATPTPELLTETFTRAAGSKSPAHISVHQVSGILAPQAGRIAYRKALAGDFTSSLALDANYIRRSDAEVKWKGFHST